MQWIKRKTGENNDIYFFSFLHSIELEIFGFKMFFTVYHKNTKSKSLGQNTCWVLKFSKNQFLISFNDTFVIYSWIKGFIFTKVSFKKTSWKYILNQSNAP